MILKLAIFLAAATLCLAGMPKLKGNIRPCKLNDYKCIGEELALNSRCKLRLKPVLKQYRLESQRFETPHFNASYIDQNLVITGQDQCYVSEFYFNMNRDSGILGIDCPVLKFESDRTLLQHWPLHEDTVYYYSYKGIYPRIVLTTALNKCDVLDMCNEFTFAYLTGLPNFKITPKDKPTKDFLSHDLSQLNIFERETFFYRANFLARTFINSRLCDFGCD